MTISRILASTVLLGFAWASILSLPYALLSDNLPAEKMGVYMGIFNFFIVIPQLLAASVLGFLLRTFLALTRGRSEVDYAQTHHIAHAAR